ncbi:hypothetical protein M0805_000255 [Coniferiporia weirii]|nr:hypothetical protein M0805_000255 [Coniferiporia weirii]
MASADVLFPDRMGVVDNIPTSHHEEFRAALLRLSPLVSVDRIKDHLLFIGAWVRFYQKAEGAGTLAALLARGVHRFELPCELPPFDVAMMLHTCMLSPHRYYEDGLTRFPQLLAIGAFPLRNIATLIDPKTYFYKATSEQIEYWEEHTGVPFDPLRCKDKLHDVTIKCSSCETDLNVMWEDDGFGYGESGFLCTCTQCGSSVSRDSLCVAKLFKDLTHSEKSGKGTMRGTLLNDRGDAELARGRLITLHVFKTLRGEGDVLPTPTEINMSTIFKNLTKDSTTKLKQARTMALLRPYTQITPFTHDLVKAVTELAQFHRDISRTGGCSPQFLSGPCTELSVACDKYNTFLELIAFPEVSGGAVPSLDLDLVWHTHQLDGCSYKETIVALTGIYADHISCTEDPEFFVEADKETRRRWDDTFGSSVPLHATKPVFGTHTSPVFRPANIVVEEAVTTVKGVNPTPIPVSLVIGPTAETVKLRRNHYFFFSKPRRQKQAFRPASQPDPGPNEFCWRRSIGVFVKVWRLRSLL